MGGRSKAAFLAGLVAVIGSGACGGGGSDASSASTVAASGSEVTADLVGAIEGSGAYVALVADDGSVRAYVCDGEEGGVASVAEWFSGEVDGDEVDLGSAGGARLVATLTDDGSEGTFIDAGGNEHAFTAERAEGDAGLYRGESDDFLGGFIVANDGTDRGGFGVAGIQRTRPAFDPSSPSAQVPGIGSVQFRRISAG
jgi:hypothetical protein